MGISGIIAIIAIAVVFFTFTHQKPNTHKSTSETKSQVTPFINNLSPTIRNPVHTQSSIQEVSPSNTPIPVLATPTPIQSTNANTFIYPNTQQSNTNGVTLILQSSDDPTTITNWYKNKIQQMGMNTTSFIVTNTNNNIDNQLSASNGRQNIHIEITKPNTVSSTTISINNS